MHAARGLLFSISRVQQNEDGSGSCVSCAWSIMPAVLLCRRRQVLKGAYKSRALQGPYCSCCAHR